MLLAEDLLLLVTDGASGRLSVPGVQADAGLGGANLVELTLLGKVDVAGEPRSSPCCTRSRASTRSSTPGPTSCPGGSSPSSRVPSSPTRTTAEAG